MSDFATADLCDEHGDAIGCCELPMQQFGGRVRFHGPAVTVACHEDIGLLRSVIGEPGEGRVLVVDGGGSLRRALMGDVIGGMAAANGWAGVVVHGAVRDVAALRTLDIGVTALGRVPRRSAATGAGRRDVAVEFGGVTFTPGAEVYCDEDGIVVLPAP
jgi:regulator of ribonuclease activity A